MLEATDILKEKAAEAVKVGSEYAEVGNEYLAQGAEVVKEYAT